jgi:hypothetical protein
MGRRYQSTLSTGKLDGIEPEVDLGAPLWALSYRVCYLRLMAATITFRPDEDAERALAALTADGTTVSSAVRAALLDAARSLAQKRLRAEAEALAADPADRAEAAQVLRDMETLRAW